MPPTKGGPHIRESSPWGGGSTLMIRAPISASIMLQIGPERIRERSTTKRSSSGRMEPNHSKERRQCFLWKSSVLSIFCRRFLDLGPHSWLEISTVSSTNAFPSTPKSVRIAPFQHLKSWRPDCCKPVDSLYANGN